MCASIAGLQDFRQEGPPGDIGVFQAAASIIVYQFTFSGITYIVAQRMGVRGWTLVTPPNTDAATVILAAIAVLPSGGLIFAKAGTYPLSLMISLTNYIEIRGEGDSTIFTLSADLAISMFNMDTIYGAKLSNFKIDGTRANVVNIAQDVAGVRIYGSQYCIVERLNISKVTVSVNPAWNRGVGVLIRANSKYNIVRDITAFDCRSGEIYIAGSSENLVENAYLYSTAATPPTHSDFVGVAQFDEPLGAMSNVIRLVHTSRTGTILPYHSINLKDNASYNIVEKCVTDFIEVGYSNKQLIEQIGNMILNNKILGDQTKIGIEVRNNSTRTIVDGNTIINCYHGIKIYGAADEHGTDLGSVSCELRNNRITIPLFEAILVNAANHNVEINNNYCESPNEYGIQVNSSDNPLINDNELTNVKLHGIVLDDVEYGEIVGNRIHDAITAGANSIRLQSSSYLIIKENVLKIVAGDGIVERGSSDYNLIAENNLLGVAGAKMDVSGTHDNVKANLGYNPKGNIATPYSVAVGFLTDAAGAQAFPTTATNYTVGQSPKLVTIYGGTITSVSIDGVATGQAGAGTFAAYRLETGQILNVVWTIQPSSVVYAC